MRGGTLYVIAAVIIILCGIIWIVQNTNIQGS